MNPPIVTYRAASAIRLIFWLGERRSDDASSYFWRIPSIRGAAHTGLSQLAVTGMLQDMRYGVKDGKQLRAHRLVETGILFPPIVGTAGAGIVF
jgi:hypothetical protein